jgi:hypothetical protein
VVPKALAGGKARAVHRRHGRSARDEGALYPHGVAPEVSRKVRA